MKRRAKPPFIACMRINKVVYHNIKTGKSLFMGSTVGKMIVFACGCFLCFPVVLFSVLQGRLRKWYKSYYLLMCQPGEWVIFSGLHGEQAHFLLFVNHFYVHNFQGLFKILILLFLQGFVLVPS